MNKKIIFKDNSGGVSVITPSPAVLKKHTIQEIAAKDVPAGKPYKIVDDSEVSSDRTFRDAWEVDEAALTDGVGSESNSFASNTLTA